MASAISRIPANFFHGKNSGHIFTGVNHRRNHIALVAFSFLTQNKSHDSFFVRGDTGNNRLPPCWHRLDGVEVDCGAINDLRQRPGMGVALMVML